MKITVGFNDFAFTEDVTCETLQREYPLSWWARWRGHYTYLRKFAKLGHLWAAWGATRWAFKKTDTARRVHQ